MQTNKKNLQNSKITIEARSSESKQEELRQKELNYLRGVIALWNKQLNEKVNVKKNVHLSAIEYKNSSIDNENEIPVDDVADMGELHIHAVKMHYQFEATAKPTENVCECVQNNDGNVVLLGEPGSGKSVALLKIAIEYAKRALNDPNSLIPLLVPLGTYKGDRTVENFLEAFLGALGKDYLKKNCAKRIIKIFDALNETDNQKYQDVIAYIKKQNRFIVSCRILDYEESFSGINNLATIEILPLDPIRIKEAVNIDLWKKLGGNEYVISAWRKITNKLKNGDDIFWYFKQEALLSEQEEEKAKEYIRLLDNVGLTPQESEKRIEMLKKGIMTLCRNPLMLSIACGLYSQQELPDTRGKLIKEFVEKSINDEIKIRNNEGEDLNQYNLHVYTLLKKAAWRIQQKRIGTDTLNIDSLIDQKKLDTKTYEKKYEQQRDIIRTACKAGVLVENSSEKSQIKFYHQLFQEYFASIQLLDKIRCSSDLKVEELFKKENWWESNGWEETIVLLAETISDIEFIEFILWLAKLQPLLTVRCIEVKKNVQLSKNVIKEIQEQWHNRIRNEAKDKNNKISIAKMGDALSRIGDPRKGIGNIIKNHLKLPDIDWRKVDGMSLSVSRGLITVNQFNSFIEDGGYKIVTEVWNNIADFENNEDMILRKEKATSRLNTPIVGITWFEACAFCNWLSQKTNEIIRLPTADEWKKIFNQRFSYNVDQKKIEEQIFNTFSYNVYNFLTASCIFELSDSTITEDLKGNAWEWCGDVLVSNNDFDPLLEEKPVSTRILKGGSWRYSDEYALPEFTLYSFPQCSRSDISFRIVRED